MIKRNKKKTTRIRDKRIIPNHNIELDQTVVFCIFSNKWQLLTVVDINFLDQGQVATLYYRSPFELITLKLVSLSSIKLGSFGQKRQTEQHLCIYIHTFT